MSIFNVLNLLGGLCLFLFGMSLMGQALERRAGSSLRPLLKKMTQSRLKGLLAGLGITGIPAFIIAIAVGVLLGVLLGECTGVLVAHFGMPPFIATLGMMKICRSVTSEISTQKLLMPPFS